MTVAAPSACENTFFSMPALTGVVSPPAVAPQQPRPARPPTAGRADRPRDSGASKDRERWPRRHSRRCLRRFSSQRS
jgi:hypothetical protein